jgi:hypothetical protein
MIMDDDMEVEDLVEDSTWCLNRRLEPVQSCGQTNHHLHTSALKNGHFRAKNGVKRYLV